MSALDLVGRANVQALGWALVHFLWQGTLAAVLLAGADALLRRGAPNARYLAACLTLLLMLTLPVVTFGLVRPSLFEAGDEAPTSRCDSCPRAGADSAPPARSRDAAPRSPSLGRATRTPAAALPEVSAGFRLVPRDWRAWLDRSLPALVAAWAAGVALLSLRFMGGWLLAQRLRRSGFPGRAAAWQETVDRLARALGIARSVRLLESVLIEVPAVIGWLRPVILLPASTLLGLSPVQLEAVLAHELAHVRRFDYLVNLLQTLAEALLFFHPAVYWVSRRMRLEREQCCDDAAVALCGDAVSYARALADLEEMRLGAAALGMAATGGSLRHRIARLLGQPAPVSRSSSRGLAGDRGLVGGLSLATLLALSASTAAPRVHSTDAVTAASRLERPTVTIRAMAVPPFAPTALVPVAGQAVPPTPPEPEAPAVDPIAQEGDEDRLPEENGPEEPAPSMAAPAIDGGKLSIQDLVALANHGVTAEYVDEMAAAGYPSLTPQELVRLRSQGVSPDEVKELADLGYRDLTPAQLLTLRAHGVSADFVRELCELGFERLSVTRLVALRAQGVSPDYIREMRSAGLASISLSGFIALRSQGVSAEYMTELAEMGYKDLSLPRLIALRGSGVSLDYVREMKELGYEGLSVPRLIALRGAGVDPEFVGAFKELGYDKLPVGVLIALRSSGVTPDFAREMQEAGYSNLSPEELIELRSQGVDPALARRFKRSRVARDEAQCAEARVGKR
jgi:beta-lactamase regulating signal transducer with metallopeptidase domain